MFGHLGCSGTIKNVDVTASYIKGSYYVGGLVGMNNGGAVNNSYYDAESSEQSDEGKGEGKTTADMKLQNTYSVWDFTDVWVISEEINKGYPYLIPPAQKIIDVPTSAIYAQAIIINTTVLPERARNNIDWNLVSGDATITGNEITFNAAGEVKIKATITKGISATEDYEQVFTITVSKKPVTITGLSAANKEYDGNTTATITGTATIDGLVTGDIVTVVNGTATFADKEVGTGKTVTFSGFSLATT